MSEGKIDTTIGEKSDMTDKKVQLIRELFRKTQDIQRHSLALTAELARANIMSILKLGNASAPLQVQLPEEEIAVMKRLITTGSSEIIESGEQLCQS